MWYLRHMTCTDRGTVAPRPGFCVAESRFNGATAHKSAPRGLVRSVPCGRVHIARRLRESDLIIVTGDEAADGAVGDEDQPSTLNFDDTLTVILGVTVHPCP